MATNSSDPDCRKPLMPNPSGAPPNFDHPTVFLPIQLGVGIPLLIIAYTFVSLRIMGTFRNERRLFLDDFLCTLALLGATSLMVTESWNAKRYGHKWDMSECFHGVTKYDSLMDALTNTVYFPAILCAKAAICILYLRLFESILWIRRTTWVVLTIYTLISLAGFSLMVASQTLSGWNNAWAPVDPSRFLIAFNVVTIITDGILLFLPIRPIFNLRFSLKKRISLLVVFFAGVGGTACTLAVIAVSVPWYFNPGWAESLFADLDTWWTVEVILFMQLIELLVTIILSCVPGLVNAWRTTLCDTILVSKIRALIDSSRSKSKLSFKEDRNEVLDTDEKFKVRINDRTVELNQV